jgi:hypothetical protein
MELSERLTATELKLAEVDRLLAETIGRAADLRDEVERIAEIQAEVLKVVDSVCPGVLPARVRPYLGDGRDANPAGS